jgi:hypothetical protein
MPQTSQRCAGGGGGSGIIGGGVVWQCLSLIVLDSSLLCLSLVYPSPSIHSNPSLLTCSHPVPPLPSPLQGEVVGIALDADQGEIVFFRTGVEQGRAKGVRGR